MGTSLACVGLLLRASLLLVVPSAPTPEVDDFLGFLNAERFAESPSGLMVCHFGFSEHTVELSSRLLRELAPPRYRTHVAFFHQPSRALPLLERLVGDFPERAHLPESVDAFGAHCSIVMLSMEDPSFTAESMRKAARGATTILSHLGTECSSRHPYACRYFQATWSAIAGAEGACGKSFCTAMVPTQGMEDPMLAAVDCDVLLGEGKPASVSSQWQQDWFVYHNFVRGTSLDTRPGDGAARRGVFVDVGAFHPVHLSNTFFFERCLGWRGVCAEPNPSWAPYFGAYRQNCQLVPNCVWSRPRSVVMSFQKDPIEAYIQEEPGSGSGAVPIAGNGTRPRFAAECRTLDDVLTAAGLRKPARIDYMSVDAEAAEVEIFRAFPFEEFDVSVVSVEVQAQNYYELDTIFVTAGYAKLAVLGGDHVYAKLQRKFTAPQGAAEWQRKIAQNFHEHAPAKSDLGQGR